MKRFKMCCSTRLFFKCAVVTLFLTLVGSFLVHVFDVGIEVSNTLPEGAILVGEFSNFEPEHPEINDRNKPVYLPAEPENMTDPIVIWWTPFTGYRRRVRECRGGKRCLFTHSRTELNNTHTSAVMFYGSDLKWTDLPLPRDPSLYWSLLHEESPKNNWVFAHQVGISLFNLTSTCSRHSNYPIVTQFLESMDKLMQPVKVPTSLKSKGGGVGLVSYIHSDCNPPSDRDIYVKELMKYVTIDSYGKCLHNKDLPEQLHDSLTFGSEELANIVGKYKFSLAFENAVCEDYITEKFWRPLKAGSVPIVRGSTSIRDWAPDTNMSIIVASDFSSPKQLAEYLLYLDSHDEAYEQLLEWKRSGVTNKRLKEHMASREWYINDYRKMNFIDGFECYVCDRVHERIDKQRRGEQVEPVIASHNHYTCDFPKPVLGITKENKPFYNDHSQLMLWRYVAKCAELQGEVVSNAIATGAAADDIAKLYNDACRSLDHSLISL